MQTKLVTANSLEEIFEAMNTPTGEQLKRTLASLFGSSGANNL